MLVIEFEKTEKGLSEALKEMEKLCPGSTTSDLFRREIGQTSSSGTLRLKISIKEKYYENCNCKH